MPIRMLKFVSSSWFESEEAARRFYSVKIPQVTKSHQAEAHAAAITTRRHQRD
jgi:hypothetical protein